MDYQNYRIRSFDDETPHQEEGQLRVQGGESAFDRAHPEPGEEGSIFEEETSQTESSEGLTDFASIKFQRENTLLTNAERYADSIREEAELYVRQLQKEIESLNEQADKRYEEARLVKEEAEAEAQRRVDEAEQRVEEIRALGHKEGYEAGHEEGLRKRYEEAGAYLQHLEEILDELTQFRRHVRYFMEKDGPDYVDRDGGNVNGRESSTSGSRHLCSQPPGAVVRFPRRTGRSSDRARLREGAGSRTEC